MPLPFSRSDMLEGTCSLATPAPDHAFCRQMTDYIENIPNVVDDELYAICVRFKFLLNRLKFQVG